MWKLWHSQAKYFIQIHTTKKWQSCLLNQWSGQKTSDSKPVLKKEKESLMTSLKCPVSDVFFQEV